MIPRSGIGNEHVYCDESRSTDTHLATSASIVFCTVLEMASEEMVDLASRSRDAAKGRFRIELHLKRSYPQW
jgi:hypothetical protein